MQLDGSKRLLIVVYNVASSLLLLDVDTFAMALRWLDCDYLLFATE